MRIEEVKIANTFLIKTKFDRFFILGPSKSLTSSFARLEHELLFLFLEYLLLLLELGK
jgi:hypothetical protein